MKKYPHYKLYFWDGMSMKRLNRKEYVNPDEAFEAFGQWHVLRCNAGAQVYLAYCTSPYESTLLELKGSPMQYEK